MHKLKHYGLLAGIWITLVGGAYLFWYYQIDGVYVNQPITYREDIDPTNYKLERTEYKRGETPRYLTAFCKNREAIPTTQWRLANDVLTVYPPRTVPDSGFVRGCFPSDNEGYVYIDIEKIPDNATNGCNHYFIGEISRDIGGGRILKQPIKTEEFCIID